MNEAARKRLVFLSHGYPEGPNDIRGRFFPPLIERLVKAGVAVDVIAPATRFDPHCFTYPGAAGETIHRCPLPADFDKLSMKRGADILVIARFIMNWHATLRRTARNHGPWDVALAAWGIPAGILLRAPALRGAKTVAWWLGTDFNRFSGLPALIRFAANGATMNWSNSHRMANELSRFVGRPINFVPLGTEIELQSRAITPAPDKAKPIRLISIGRLAPVKGFDIAIQAIRRLLESGMDITYDIVGEGPQRNELETLIGDWHTNIFLHGFLENPAMANVMRAADLYLLPSRNEGLPLTFLEALCAGLPIIASDIGDFQQCLADSTLGKVFPAGDAQALAEVIKLAANGRLSFDPLRAQAILEEYSIEKTVEAVFEILAG